MDNVISEAIKQAYLNTTGNSKFYAVMLFCTEVELGISTVPNKWVNVKNLFFDNGTQALWTYSNTPNPASQLIDAQSQEELETKMEDMINNFKNKEWLENELYPYL